MKLNTALFIALFLIAAIFLGKYLYYKPKHINGEKAPFFSATLKDGSLFKLSDLNNKLVLIDFWGSWCGPCRKENPAIVALYNKFHASKFENSDGFEIVSIGIERDRKRWESAIRKDGLDWKYHIMDITTSMKFFNSKIGQLFGIKEVPSKFLINEDGYIISVNPTVKELDQLLTKRAL